MAANIEHTKTVEMKWLLGDMIVTFSCVHIPVAMWSCGLLVEYDEWQTKPLDIEWIKVMALQKMLKMKRREGNGG